MSRRTRTFRRALAPAAAAVLLALAALATAPLAADGDTATRTLIGEYYWSGGGSSGDLEAVFTATGEGVWDVDFHFRFRGKAHTYSGSAKGSFEGELSGRVKTENERRTFTFSGEFVDGVFEGRHAEEFSSGERRTGTLTMS